MDSVIRINKGRNVAELVLVSLAPRLCASETRFLRACEDNSELGVFKFDALVLESLEERNSHIAAAEVVVCAVNNTSVINHKVKTDEKGNKDQSDKTCLAERR